MTFKQIVFYAGCAASWFILLPVLVVCGGIALVAYAVLSEVIELFIGHTDERLDKSTAREIAQRMCLGR